MLAHLRRAGVALAEGQLEVEGELGFQAIELLLASELEERDLFAAVAGGRLRKYATTASASPSVML